MSDGPGDNDANSPIDSVEAGSQASSRSSEPPWWRDKKLARPWEVLPKKKKTIPPEQVEGFSRARKAVARAARSVLGTASDVAHEALLLSVEPLTLVPIPGLNEAAKTLLLVWDALEQVETNRMACVSLVERCAVILFAVREEIDLAGGEVGTALQDPVERLTDAFKQTQDTLKAQWDKPFLKRYLQRESDLRRISGCNQALTDAVSMFSLSIQIRTLKQLQESEAARRQDMGNFRPNVAFDAIYPPSPLLRSLGSIPRGPISEWDDAASTVVSVSGVPRPRSPTPEEVLASIKRLQLKHSTIDATLDAEDLRSLLRAALHSPDDAAMIKILQVDRPEWPEAIKTLQRHLEEMRNVDAKSGVGVTRERQTNETIHREFVESGIETLRRMSGDGDVAVPSWTITRFEVDTDRVIAYGTFSQVYVGSWKSRTVAIKVLSPNTPRSLFVHEAEIWAKLSHPNVLRIWGASSATSDPPWFFVSPYMKNGTLVRYLKEMKSQNGGKSLPARANVIGMMRQIAVGMSYLHSKDVLHGDLKAINILIDDDRRCVISDFGQSRLKSEVFRITGQAEAGEKPGTTRWQAPEILNGQTELTMEVDAYAFAVTCVEILTGGEIPWPNLDDAAVRALVVVENKRPTIPRASQTTPVLISLINSCWHSNKNLRPPFVVIAKHLSDMVNGTYSEDLLPPNTSLRLRTPHQEHVPSPPMRPLDTLTPVGSSLDLAGSMSTIRKAEPQGLGLKISEPMPGGYDSHPGGQSETTSGSSGNTPSSEYSTAHSTSVQSTSNHSTHGSSEEAASGQAAQDADAADPARTPRAGRQHPVLPEITDEDGIDIIGNRPGSARPSSMFSSTNSMRDTEEDYDYCGWESPPPSDEIIALRRDERRYRLLLNHEFYAALKLPLWTPSRIKVGAVGYHSRPNGEFITLFNAFEAATDVKSRTDTFPSLHGYGQVSLAKDRRDAKGARERMLEGFMTFLPTFAKPTGSTQRISFPLRADHKHAYLYTETTIYRYMSNLTTPKRWFKANIDGILRFYGPSHRLQKEDVLLVVGSLEAPDYGMFVSHKSPDGQVHFNVFNDKRPGSRWGEFKMDRVLPEGSFIAGPSWVETEGARAGDEVCSQKSSTNGESSKGWDSLILARLRFRPDEEEPTSQ